MKTFRVIDAGTYYRVRSWTVEDDCSIFEETGEPIITIEYDENYSDMEVEFNVKEPE